MERCKKDDLLEIIPKSVLQQLCRPDGGDKANTLPVYKLLRVPSHFSEFDWKKYRGISIWTDNGTLICVCKYHSTKFSDKRVVFQIDHGGETPLECAIYGKTDAAIAETAIFFWSLKHSEEIQSCLKIYNYEDHRHGTKLDKRFHFDFTALTAEQLARILDANPIRRLQFRAGIWNAEQAFILATRPYPLDLELTFSEKAGGFLFEDGGTAFVDTLEKRQLPFGSFHIKAALQSDNWECVWNTDKMPISRTNRARICQLSEMFDTLSISPLDEESVFLPFSANVKALNYRVDAKYMEPDDCKTLDIVTKDLNLKIYTQNDGYWDELLIASLNWLAELGHFERLSISIDEYWAVESGEVYDFESVAPVAKALIRVINGNPNLTYLDLSDSYWLLYWGPHLKNILKAMEKHRSLRTFIVNCDMWEDVSDDDGSEVRGSDDRELAQDQDQDSNDDRVNDEDSDESDSDNNNSADGGSDGGDSGVSYSEGPPLYCWLERLLSRNRNMTVLDKSGERHSNGTSINRLYLLNHLYIGSQNLVTESASVRPSLVATALVEITSKSFQLTSLLLSNHTDILCELIHGLDVEDERALQSMAEEPEDAEPPAISPPESNQSDTSKRKLKIQPSRATKKASRHET